MSQKLLEKANKLPLKPGVYQMLGPQGEVLYVGKAKSLKNRVSSYFLGAHDDKTTRLVSKIKDIAVIICKSEFDALVLECSLIKEHAPRYNILLKDDKGYPFIRLDAKTPYPRFSIVSKRGNDGAKYFGPFGGRGMSKDAISALNHALKLPACSRKFPRDIGKERPCLNYHMGLCMAYCKVDVPQTAHQERLKQAVAVLEGRAGQIVANLQEQMETAAGEMRFEQAAELRDRIRALERLETKQTVVALSLADSDVLGYYPGAAKSAFVVMQYIGGRLLHKDYALIERPMEAEAEAVSALIKQYYETAQRYPRFLYLPCGVEDSQEIEAFLSERAGHRVEIQVPQRGEKRQLVEIAWENAKAELERVSVGEEKVRGILSWLEQALNLDKPPIRIEAYDVSNFGDQGIVAAMTVFEKAKPKKNDYRKFQIKGQAGQDDYGSLKEALERRLKRYLEEDPKFSKLPDLLLVDGGVGHAGVAKAVLEEKGISLPVFGMVKDERHRTRALVSPQGEEIGMGAVPQVFSFIGQIQEETHRFAINYQKTLRTKGYKSVLDDIPGVGEGRRNALFRTFKTVKAIKAASQEELSKVVPKNVAIAIGEHFKQLEEEGK